MSVRPLQTWNKHLMKWNWFPPTAVAGDMMTCWSKSWLCLCLSWDSELPGEFRGCRLWDIPVLHQQLLRDPRPAPHLPHAAAQRRALRLTGGSGLLFFPPHTGTRLGSSLLGFQHFTLSPFQFEVGWHEKYLDVLFIYLNPFCHLGGMFVV